MPLGVWLNDGLCDEEGVPVLLGVRLSVEVSEAVKDGVWVTDGVRALDRVCDWLAVLVCVLDWVCVRLRVPVCVFVTDGD